MKISFDHRWPSACELLCFHTNLFVCTDTRRTAEVELVSLDGEFLTGPRVAVTIKAAAFAAVHGQLANLAPGYETSITTESVQTTLMVDLVLNLKAQRRPTMKKECGKSHFRTRPGVSYPVGDLADAANRSLGLFFHGFLGRLLGRLLRWFVRPFVRGFVWLFLVVSEDRQAKQTTEVQVAVVLRGDRYHVPGLKNLPAKE